MPHFWPLHAAKTPYSMSHCAFMIDAIRNIWSNSSLCIVKKSRIGWCRAEGVSEEGDSTQGL